MSDLSNIYETIWDGQLSCYDTETIIIGESEYPCDSGELTFGENLVPGGEWSTNTIQISCKRSLFDPLPGLQSRVLFRSVIYRIDRLRDEPDQGIVIFELVPAHET